MNRNDAVRVRHTIEAGEAALRFVDGRRRVDLDSDEMLRFALVRAIEVIGEAASRISLDTRRATSAVPWADAVLMRNRLSHVYFDTDNSILRKTATEEIPMPLPLLRPLLPVD